jgi:hypothetical protein
MLIIKCNNYYYKKEISLKIGTQPKGFNVIPSVGPLGMAVQEHEFLGPRESILKNMQHFCASS